ncbi:hypothetical protein F2P79_024219 [Pimephales promelas]|nr:hypothetical protein F2P79_024219 [Pimephales promelas]
MESEAPKVLHAIYIPGDRNLAADELSRLRPISGEWRLHPQTVQLIGTSSGTHRSVCLPRLIALRPVLLPDRGHIRHGRTRTQLAAGPTQVCISPNEPSRTDSVQDQGGRGAGHFGCAVLAHPRIVLATAPPWPIPLRKDLLSQRRGTLWHPRSDLWRLHVWLLDGTRQWNLLVNWCPRRCSISVLLSFLQDGLERRLSPSTLKVYVAAIAAYKEAVEGKLLGKHDLIVSKFLSMKTALLVALASIKRVGDLHAFDVDEASLEFGRAYFHVILRPRPGYVPKVPTTPFRDQVVNLQALPQEEADHWHCSVQYAPSLLV